VGYESIGWDIHMTETVSTYRPAGTLNLSAALEPYRGPWNERLAAHLMRRAGFGGTPEQVAALGRQSMDRAVDSLVKFPSTTALPAAPGDMPSAGEVMDSVRSIAMAAGKDDDALKEARKQLAALYRRGYEKLGRWWLDRMIATPAPLQEKMTLMWHGHFASATGQKGITPSEGLAQNQLFRTYALGNVRELAHNIIKDPAMLKYLDNTRSRKEHPNENLARELMELFTLGIGNYTETDVREGARALTGYSVARGTGEFAFYDRYHDDGEKLFLGRRGSLNGDSVVDIIFDQPAASRWFSRKLLNFYVYNDPEPDLVGAVAALMVKNQYNLLPVMSTLLRSNVFYSDRAYRALVKSPAEFVVGTYQLLGAQQSSPAAVVAMARMGQVLFRPPSVKGWDGGATWLNSQTMLTRENFVSSVMTAEMTGGAAWMAQGGINAPATANHFVSTILQGDASAASVARVVSYLNGASDSAMGAFSGENYEERLRGAAYLTMAMPAYQLA
jgi:uncharacterized protein (DUF1800 family)